MKLPRPLFTSEQIRTRIQGLAREIEKDSAAIHDVLVVVCVLKGAFVFCADLIRELRRPLRLEFIQLSSYGAERESSGEVELKKDVEASVEDQHVLVIEDIVDTGLTCQFLRSHLAKSKSLRFVTLLDKPSRRKVSFQPDFVAFEVEDQYVVGYGLDDNQLWRELPYVGICEDIS